MTITHEDAVTRGINAHHPDIPVAEVQISNGTFSPMLDVLTVPVCYQELSEKVIGWGPWKRRVSTREHRHHVAVLAPNRPWFFAGTDAPVPRELVRKLNDTCKINKGEVITPQVISHALAAAFKSWDAISRENLFEILCDLPVTGDELMAYVSRRNRLREASQN